MAVPEVKTPGPWAHVAAFYRGMLRLGPAGLLTAIASVSPLIGGFLVLGFIQHLAPWIQTHGIAGSLVYVIAFWFLGGFAIVPTYAYSGLAGWTFGVVTGFWLAMAAFTGASFLGYALAQFREAPVGPVVRMPLIHRLFGRFKNVGRGDKVRFAQLQINTIPSLGSEFHDAVKRGAGDGYNSVCQHEMFLLETQSTAGTFSVRARNCHTAMSARAKARKIAVNAMTWVASCEWRLFRIAKNNAL